MVLHTDLYRWSFGGNKLQIKAEVQLITDVEKALSAVAHIGSQATKTLVSLIVKQETLVRLIESEHTRLQVWLFPTEHEKRRLFRSARGSQVGVSTSNHLESQVLFMN